MKHDVRIYQTERTVEIRNSKDVLKYKVVLRKSQRDDYELDESVDIYNVVVVSYVEDPDGEEFPPSRDFTSLKEADIEFDRTVKNYTIIVKAQSKPVDDISVYAEKIEYVLIDPDCCFNCKYCNHWYDRCGTAHHRPYNRSHLVCENPENFTVFQNMVGPRPYSDFMHRDFHHGFHPSMHDRFHDTCGGMHRTELEDLKTPTCGKQHEPDCQQHGVWDNPHFYSLEVRPRVHPNGLCKRYERAVPGRKHHHGFRPDDRIYCDDIFGLKKFVDDRIGKIDGDSDGETDEDQGGAGV